MWNSISHPTLQDFEGIRSHNPTTLLCLSPKTTQYAREIASLTGRSSHKELNWPVFFLAQKMQPIPRGEYLSLDLDIWRLTAYPCRDGAPFLHLMDTSDMWALIALFPCVTPFFLCIPSLIVLPCVATKGGWWRGWECWWECWWECLVEVVVVGVVCGDGGGLWWWWG